MRETKILCILPKMHLWALKCSCDSFLLGNSWDQEGWCIVKCEGKTGKTAHLEFGEQAAGFGWEKMWGLCSWFSPSALAQAVMWIFHHLLQTKTRLCCLHDLLNLADSSWRSVPAHIVPLAALWLTGKEEINYRLGQHLPPLFAKRRIASGLRGPVTEASTGSKLPEHWFSIFH